MVFAAVPKTEVNPILGKGGVAPPKRGLGANPPILGNFCGYIAYGCPVFSGTDSPHPKPPVPTCGPPSLLGGNKGRFSPSFI